MLFHNVHGSGVNVTFSGIGLQIRKFHGEGIPGTNYPDSNVLSTTLDAQNITVTFSTGFSADSVSVVNLNSGAKLFTQEVDVIKARAFSSEDPNQSPLSQVTRSFSPLPLGGPGIRMAVMRRVEMLEAWARDHGHSLLDLAFAWLLARPAVASVIAGATKPEQVRANVEAGEWEPSEEDLAALRALR